MHRIGINPSRRKIALDEDALHPSPQTQLRFGSSRSRCGLERGASSRSIHWQPLSSGYGNFSSRNPEIPRISSDAPTPPRRSQELKTLSLLSELFEAAYHGGVTRIITAVFLF